jgi:hypothetical protein
MIPDHVMPECDLSDEAASYIAEALMALALQFESTYLAQIRRHYESMTPLEEEDDRQLDLFQEDPPF